jgi:hypothetical protein
MDPLVKQPDTDRRELVVDAFRRASREWPEVGLIDVMVDLLEQREAMVLRRVAKQVQHMLEDDGMEDSGAISESMLQLANSWETEADTQ